jgi:hypothetical protein
MAGWQARHAHWDAEIQGRWDRAGLPESVWVQALATVYPGGDLGLRLGAGAALGPTAQRPMDHFWSVGLSWRPPAPVPPETASSLTEEP